jgi:hypothetical protein
MYGKKMIGATLAGVALLVLGIACVDTPTAYTVELKTPECASPAPFLPLDSATISLGCPFRYLDNVTGDTLTWVPVFN